eukprot:g1784.t1
MPTTTASCFSNDQIVISTTQADTTSGASTTSGTTGDSGTTSSVSETTSTGSGLTQDGTDATVMISANLLALCLLLGL